MSELTPSKKIIDLGVYSTKESIVLSGRPKGEGVREELHIDELDVSRDEFIVKIPDRIISLNSSFFLGLFTGSIKRLGISAFESKYTFECRDVVLEDIERGKKEALNQANPLKSK